MTLKKSNAKESNSRQPGLPIQSASPSCPLASISIGPSYLLLTATLAAYHPPTCLAQGWLGQVHYNGMPHGLVSLGLSDLLERKIMVISSVVCLVSNQTLCSLHSILYFFYYWLLYSPSGLRGIVRTINASEVPASRGGGGWG